MPVNRRSCHIVSEQHLYLINFPGICFFYGTIRKNNQQGDLHLSHRVGVLDTLFLQITQRKLSFYAYAYTFLFIYVLLRIHHRCDQIRFVCVFGRLSVTVKNNSVFNQ